MLISHQWNNDMDTQNDQRIQRHALRLRVDRVAQARGFTRSSLSKAARLSYATINTLWSNPQSHPRVSTLDQIAQALGVTLNDLVEHPTLTENLQAETKRAGDLTEDKSVD